MEVGSFAELKGASIAVKRPWGLYVNEHCDPVLEVFVSRITE